VDLLVRLVLVVVQDQVEHQVHLDQAVHPVQVDLLDLLGHPEQVAHQVRQVLVVVQDLMDLREPLEQADPLVLLVQVVRLEHPVQVSVV
jgi:hypothetical protein